MAKKRKLGRVRAVKRRKHVPKRNGRQRRTDDIVLAQRYLQLPSGARRLIRDLVAMLSKRK